MNRKIVDIICRRGFINKKSRPLTLRNLPLLPSFRSFASVPSLSSSSSFPSDAASRIHNSNNKPIIVPNRRRHLHTYTLPKLTTFSTDTDTKSLFHTEAEYHDAADETLEYIQDALETSLESLPRSQLQYEYEYEINLASGVLTITLPPYGTWVINKQTPNRQIWWSSPMSGPRRYEWDEGVERWVYSLYVDDGDGRYLGDLLEEEMKVLFGGEEEEEDGTFELTLDTV